MLDFDRARLASGPLRRARPTPQPARGWRARCASSTPAAGWRRAEDVAAFHAAYAAVDGARRARPDRAAGRHRRRRPRAAAARADPPRHAGRAHRVGRRAALRAAPARRIPWLDEALRASPARRGRARSRRSSAGCARGRWDVALDLGRGIKSALLARAERGAGCGSASRAPTRARAPGCSRRAPVPPQGVERPKLEQFLAFGDAARPAVRARRVRPRADAEEERRRPRRCSPDCARPIVAACVGSSCPSRRWFPERDGGGAERGSATGRGGGAVLLGTAADAAFAAAVARAARGARARSRRTHVAAPAHRGARRGARSRSGPTRGRSTWRRRSECRWCRCGARPARSAPRRSARSGWRSRASAPVRAVLPARVSDRARVHADDRRAACRAGEGARGAGGVTLRALERGGVAGLASRRCGARRGRVPRGRRGAAAGGARGTRAASAVATAHGVVFVKSYPPPGAAARAARVQRWAARSRPPASRRRVALLVGARDGAGLLVTADAGGEDLLAARRHGSRATGAGARGARSVRCCGALGRRGGAPARAPASCTAIWCRRTCAGADGALRLPRQRPHAPRSRSGPVARAATWCSSAASSCRA